MPKLDIRDRIVEMTGGRDVVLGFAHKTSEQLGDAGARVRVAIMTALSPKLNALIVDHLAAVVSEHELLEGERVGEDGVETPEVAAWDSALDDAFRSSLNDLVPGILSVSEAERLTVDAQLHDDDRLVLIADELTQAIVGGDWDLGYALGQLGITKADLDALATPVAEETQSGPVGGTVLPEQRDMIVDTIRQFLNSPDGDMMDCTAYLADMAGEEIMAASACSKLGFKYPQATLPLIRAIAADAGTWADDLVMEAMQEPAAKPGKAQKAAEKLAYDLKLPGAKAPTEPAGGSDKPKSTRGAKTTNAAAVAAMEGLLAHSDMSEANVASLLGMSRAQMNKIRKGEAHYEPNETAIGVLREALDSRVRTLGALSAEL